MSGSTVSGAGLPGSEATSRSAVGALLSRTCHPLLLVSVGVVFVMTTRYGWDTGRVTFAFQLSLICYLAVLERVIPYERAWHPSRREWRWYGVYFVLTTVGGTLAQSTVVVAAGALARNDPVLPLWAEIPLAVLLGSLAGYTVHRLGHTNRWLWRLHGVHHVPEKVNVANNGVNHIADVFVSQAFVQVSLAIVGFSATTVFGAGLFVVAQGYFVHANIAVRLGRLNHVFVGPEQHRLHHSTDLAEAGHYGSDLSIWDRAFGSFTWRPGREPAAVGLVDPRSFPGTGAIVATLAHPVRRRARTGRATD
ncbi:sterol desaturase family protein [Streptomyces sp. NPDC059134]|uniref:sterol desaturase family protein n=1 Tax=Streptomyces sp. NPDC059134 TaxID=3346738 RepID=UPI0036A1EC3A